MTATIPIAVVSGSLNPESVSRMMARHVMGALEGLGAKVDFIDLQEIPLPMCDGDRAYADPQVARIRERIAASDAVVIAAPVYNYYLNAALKNLVELTGKAWEDKIVGFLNAAGGASSYMSVMSLANSLMLDFRSIIVPRFVYATSSAFREGVVSDRKVAARIDELAREIIRFGTALKRRGP